MALALDFLKQPVNVQWGGGLHFLYSGADGMFGSKDGETWKEAPLSVAATGLAYVDDVWLAVGSGGLWRSVDGAATWQLTGGPEFEQIAACKPTGSTDDEDGDGIKGIFAGFKEDEDGDNNEVYLSRDLGRTWTKELMIPTSIPYGDNQDGFESGRVLSGCGNGIFLTTIKGDTLFSNGDGCFYVSTDGGSFGGRQQVWSGTNKFAGDPDPHYKGYSPGAVGFDPKRKRFCLMYLKEEGFGPGGALGSLTEYSIGYGTGSGGSFSGENEIIKRTKEPLATSFSQVSGGLAAAGGGGKFAATYNDLYWADANGPPLKGDLTVVFFDGGSGSEILISVPNMFGEDGSQVGPVCWKPGDGEVSTDTPTEHGIFACLAFGVGGQGGGVWIEKDDGGWQKTHNGQGIAGGLRGALAVGKLSWLGSGNGA